MAMVKITNGDVVNVVSRGAYESTFKNLGFKIVGEPHDAKSVEHVSEPVVNSEPETVEEEATDEATTDEADDDIDELLEKPISQWTSAEVKDFANAKGINLKGTKNANDAKEIIKKYLEEEAKKEVG